MDEHVVADRMIGPCQSIMRGLACAKKANWRFSRQITKASRGPDADGSREAKRSRSTSKPDCCGSLKTGKNRTANALRFLQPCTRQRLPACARTERFRCARD